MVRFKNRHLVLALVWKDGKIHPSLKEMVILNAVRESIKESFGDVVGGLSSAALRLGPYNPLSSVCVLRCGRDQQREVSWAPCVNRKHPSGRSYVQYRESL
jgi:RNase P/RNase MRP subunit POP5